MTNPAPHRDDPHDRITLTLRRSHLYAIGGLALGLALGLAAGRGMGRATGVLAAPVVPPAAAAPNVAPNSPAAPDAATLARALDVAGRPAWGPADAQVTVVEFTDYQCPYCREHFDSTLATLRLRFEGRVRYAVKNYPIGALHPNSFRAAEAAECAAEQGKYWQYHDRLFRAASLDRAELDRIARAVGLDAARFGRCVDSRAMSLRVQRDLADGAAAGVAGTPSFFVNGRKLEGAVPLEAFAQIIDAALATASAQGATP